MTLKKNKVRILWAIGGVAMALSLILISKMVSLGDPIPFSVNNLFKGHKVTFEKIILDHDFISGGVTIGDVNNDGKSDIMAGDYWFEAPSWEKHTMNKQAKVFSVTSYSNSFLNYAMDVNQDGWIDEIRVGFPGGQAYWFENPGKKKATWKRHLIYAHVGDESPGFADINGDKRKDLFFADVKNNQWVWASPPAIQDTNWMLHPFGTTAQQNATGLGGHGLGSGDVNGDGRLDILVKTGWWEGPSDFDQFPWKFHHADLGPDCAQMYVMDVDRDGSQDVISSSAHHYGIWWYKQNIQPSDKTTWIKQVIYKGFSQSHALAMADINGDGWPDLVTGKRFFAHNGEGIDPGDHQPAVLYWFEYRPDKKKPRWLPHKIDDNSGVGLQVIVRDINRDGLADIVVANKKGVFLFKQLNS